MPKLALPILFAGLASTSPLAAQGPPVTFEDVTQSAFLNNASGGTSFGAGSWGDFDGDGDPDLWLSNHARLARLFQNQGDGTFVEVTGQMFPGVGATDSHGAVWGDFDRDGDLDLFESVGAMRGTGYNRLWRNDYPGPFVDVAQSRGLGFPDQRGRTPLWFDWNEDGLLDLVQASYPGTGSEDSIFTQLPSGLFQKVGAAEGFTPSGGDTRVVQLADLDADGKPELVFHDGAPFPTQAWNYSASGFTPMPLGSAQRGFKGAQDFVAADFDNDLDQDIYLTRDAWWVSSEVGIGQGGELRISVKVDAGGARIRFSCPGDLILKAPIKSPQDKIFLGQNRVPANANPVPLAFDDSRVLGINPGTPGVERALYLGRDPAGDTWQLDLASDREEFINVVVQSASPIQILDAPKNEYGFADAMLIQNEAAGIDAKVLSNQLKGRGAVAGDFDNDGDLDLYVVRSGTAVNQANVLLENIGGGQYRPWSRDAGVLGTLRGVGDNVSLVDYDEDGFLDLFLTNGFADDTLALNAPVVLLRNEGNGHHWLQIDLDGTSSNPSGIGAVVYVRTAAGTQRRDQMGGVHRFTQNHERLHFGLGDETLVQEIRVCWPNGHIQTLTNVSVDQILTIQQP